MCGVLLGADCLAAGGRLPDMPFDSKMDPSVNG